MSLYKRGKTWHTDFSGSMASDFGKAWKRPTGAMFADIEK